MLAKLGAADEQEQLDRRKREVHDHFEVKKIRHGREVRHQLVGRRTSPRVARGGLSGRVRAAVLQHGRCAMCGRTPTEDGIKLVVDHRIPLEWGGTNNPENLQALCEEDNEGKKDYFASFDEYVTEIRQAIGHMEPHRRIGELLKAFRGRPVRSDLLEMVAHAHQHQEDWQKRLRELRTLGWDIKVTRRREGKRVRAYYRLDHDEPWPEGSIRGEITRRERANKRKR